MAAHLFQNSFRRQRNLTLVDEKRSVVSTQSAFQSPVKVDRAGFGKVRNSDGKFLFCNLLCSNLPRMIRVLIFQPRYRWIGINISKKNTIVGTANFQVQPKLRSIIAPASQQTVDSPGLDQFKPCRGGAEMQKRNSRTPLLVFPGTELSGHQQSAADYGSKTP